MSNIALKINDKLFTGWKRLALDSDMDSLSNSFSFSARDKDNILAEIIPGTTCSVVINDNISVLTGFITDREQRLTATSNDVTVSGNDKLVDIVDCSATVRNGVWVNKKFSAIIRDLLADFNIELDITTLVEDPIIAKLSLKTGEKVFDIIERLCRSYALLPLATKEGKLKLSSTAENVAATVDLVEGVNIKEVTKTEDWNERFSEYVCLNQVPGNGKKWTKEMVQGNAVATDRDIQRYRPLFFTAEKKIKQTELSDRVAWEAQIRAGRSLSYSVLLRGWQQIEGGILWEKNKLVRLSVPSWGLDTHRRITRVSFTLDENGEQTLLGLRHPDIYKPNPSREVTLT